jgi:very-short-patch-repair endonuclease
MKYERNTNLRANAKTLRHAYNLAEVLLWNEIKAKKLGVGFLRQAVMGNYIVDFYSPKVKLIIEIDGESHIEKAEYDAKRDAYLHGLGLKVLHILDIDVKKNLESVVEMLKIEVADVPT